MDIKNNDSSSSAGLQHSHSEVLLGNQSSSWADLKQAIGLKKRSNTAQNLQFYVEEQKRLYQELPFLALPGMRSQSFQRERSASSKQTWGSFSSLLGAAEKAETEPLLDQFDDEPGYTRPLVYSCCVALLSAFQFGYNTGVTGAVSADLIFPGHTSLQWAMIVSAFPIGGPIGSLLAGTLSTRLGRKKALILNSAVFVIAGLLMSVAWEVYILVLGRVIVGLAAGMVSVIVPLYLGELAPPNLRGSLGTGYQFGVVVGILSADILAFFFPGAALSWRQPGWRAMFGFTILPGVLQMAFSAWLNESPRWLLSQNKPKDAADILRRLRGTHDVYEEIDSICCASDSEVLTVSVFQVLQDRSIRYALLVGIGLQVIQQFSGINAVIFYANSFFSNVGLANPLVGTTLVGAINVLATGVALVLMDRVGRRVLLLWSSMGMLISALILTVALLQLMPHSHAVSVVAMMSYVWFFEIGLGPIPWLIVAEMFPAQPRPTAMSLATMVNWICSFIIGLIFPMLQAELNNWIFVPFALVLLLAYGFTIRFVPETKGKTLEEIQDELQASS